MRTWDLWLLHRSNLNDVQVLGHIVRQFLTGVDFNNFHVFIIQEKDALAQCIIDIKGLSAARA